MIASIFILFLSVNCSSILYTWGWFDPFAGECPELAGELCDPSAGHLISYPTPIGDLTYGDWRPLAGSVIRLRVGDVSSSTHYVSHVITAAEGDEWLFFMEIVPAPEVEVAGWIPLAICAGPRVGYKNGEVTP